MGNTTTCGQGLAEHAVLPARMAELIGALAENLERHQKTLDPGDDNARRELGGPALTQAFERFVDAEQALARSLEHQLEEPVGVAGDLGPRAVEHLSPRTRLDVR